MSMNLPEAPPCLVINLDRNPERWEKSTTQLNLVGIAHERVPAVEGGRLSAEEIGRVYDERLNRRRFFRPLTRGELGCYLSHHRCAEIIVARGWAGAVILEDDFVLGADFASAIKCLGSNLDGIHLVKLWARRRAGHPVWQLATGHKIIISHRPPAHTVGYYLSQEGARRWLQKGLPATRPIDVQHKHFWEQDLTCAIIEPGLLEPQTDDASTIGNRRHLQRSWQVRLRRLLYKLDYTVSRWTYGRSRSRQRL